MKRGKVTIKSYNEFIDEKNEKSKPNKKVIQLFAPTKDSECYPFYYTATYGITRVGKKAIESTQR